MEQLQPTKESNQETNLSKNHLELGHELKLFFFDQVSPGSCFFLPHGAIVHQKMITYLRKFYRQGCYQEVIGPNIYDKKLWITSGHWDKYRSNMFLIQQEREGVAQEKEISENTMEFSLKAMNCPSHCLIFRQMKVNYRQLPLKLAEFGVLHRNESSGSLRGLTRVRRFQQDDAHIFCSLDQIEGEITELLEFIDQLYTDLRFTYQVEVSTRPEENYLGELAQWNQAEEILKRVVTQVSGNDKILINPGDGAFYGPKIDISIKDSLDRWNQCGTIQLDFNLPERFDLKYSDYDGQLKRPIMIHRALFGSLERFLAIILEHTQGKLPFWMSPRQVMVLPILKEHHKYAVRVVDYLREKFELEVESDLSNDDLRQKIKNAEIMKFNYIIVIGDREVKDQTVAVRFRDVQPGEKKTQVMTLDEFVKYTVVY